MKLLFLLYFLFTFPATAKVNCNIHKIYCKIVKTQPSIDKNWAMKLSDILYRKTKEYNIDPNISIAIAAQESGIKNINRKARGYPLDCRKGDCKLTTVLTDIGIFQLHVNTITNYGFNVDKLLIDIEYQVECHLRILKQKIKMCKHLGKEAWSCYHSTTAKYRKSYVKAVSRYLK